MTDPIRRDRLAARYWENKSLAEMNTAEWEALCDGCGRCCTVKLEDEDSGELHYTNVACHLLDLRRCRCRDYRRRAERVPGCLRLAPAASALLRQLPASCAYRRLAEGRGLPDWHPLVSGDPASVHAAGVSVRGKVVAEQYIHPEQLPDHIVSWITAEV